MRNRVLNFIVLQDIGPNEIFLIIFGLDSNKSKDLDCLTVNVLKAIKQLVSLISSGIINKSFFYEIFTKSLKVAKVIFLFKDGNTSNPSNHTTILLLCHVSKVYEKIIHKRLVDFPNKHKIFG